MRQRKAKDLEKRLERCGRYMVEYPSVECGSGYFEEERELFLEIGCGKGNFIIKKACDNPDKNFIAVEGQETVILRALEKTASVENSGKKIGNLKFMPFFIDRLEDVFPENSLSGIYLNFSDPWPKARHAKRRLTHRRYLKDYAWALKPGGFIEFKTDNDGLFEFSLEEIEACGGEIEEITRDLHGSGYASKDTTSEYEDKFRLKGKNINYVRFTFN